MRTYGRVYDKITGLPTWVEVDSDSNGHDDWVYVTTLIQCLKLFLGESPFYANYGIPAQQAIIQQLFPDFYVAQTQTQFAQFFASLLVSKVTSPTPTYNINAVTNAGTKVALTIPV